MWRKRGSPSRQFAIKPRKSRVRVAQEAAIGNTGPRDSEGKAGAAISGLPRPLQEGKTLRKTSGANQVDRMLNRGLEPQSVVAYGSELFHRARGCSQPLLRLKGAGGDLSDCVVNPCAIARRSILAQRRLRSLHVFNRTRNVQQAAGRRKVKCETRINCDDAVL